MDTAVINIKIDPKVKIKAQAVAGELGFSLSALIKGYLSQLVRSKRVMFDLKEEPSEFMINALRASEEDVKNGRVSPVFSDPTDAIAWLKSSSKKKYGNKAKRKI